ncbi:hypothetical protein EVAR_57591_1 [Eumeta japonica]|uniref:Uncharacterized protein n=1 Tax=Eumeta variegata TaxID=151549 RepID=A0A4C1Y1I8_EUMVA|nr:hypothetical protein EVAR_57591_1 [Eumeta japonica]
MKNDHLTQDGDVSALANKPINRLPHSHNQPNQYQKRDGKQETGIRNESRSGADVKNETGLDVESVGGI